MRQITSLGNLPSPLQSLVKMSMKTGGKIYAFLLTSGNKIDRIKNISIDKDLSRQVLVDKKTGRYYYVAFGKPIEIDHQKQLIKEGKSYVLYFTEITSDQFLTLQRKMQKIMEQERASILRQQELLEKGYRVTTADITDILGYYEPLKPIS